MEAVSAYSIGQCCFQHWPFYLQACGTGAFLCRERHWPNWFRARSEVQFWRGRNAVLLQFFTTAVTGKS